MYLYQSKYGLYAHYFTGDSNYYNSHSYYFTKPINNRYAERKSDEEYKLSHSKYEIHPNGFVQYLKLI